MSRSQENFRGTVCSGCGGVKIQRRSHCSVCFYRLPISIRSALYHRFGVGYEEAFDESVEWLKKHPRARRSEATEAKEK